MTICVNESTINTFIIAYSVFPKQISEEIKTKRVLCSYETKLSINW